MPSRWGDAGGSVILAVWGAYCWVTRKPRNHQQAREWRS